jgi:hypothetical protein
MVEVVVVSTQWLTFMLLLLLLLVVVVFYTLYVLVLMLNKYAYSCQSVII